MAHMRNPIATEQQNALERRALEFIKHPKLVETKAEIKEYWLKKHNPVGEMRTCFDWAFEEVMFAAVVWSLNQDPLYPQVITITRLPHKLGGLDIPGTRWGIDNPDSIYRVIPISGAEKYLIKGKVPEKRMTENYFTLWDKKMHTVDVFNGKELVLDADGRFVITVDSDPVNGRSNHVRSAPEAHQFYIRDVMLDWETDMINELSIERLGPPSRPPFSAEEQLEITLKHMWDWATETDRWNSQMADKTTNSFEYTIDRETDGALRNQIYVMGDFKLKSDDDTLVLDVNLGGAEYFIAPITNKWGTTNDILNRNGSMNKAQSVPNADGTYTFVVALKDPGVHNWIDTCDLHEGILTLRWAEFPDAEARRSVSVTSKVVPLGQLKDHLPAGTKFVTSAERQQQLQRRAASYQWRLLEA